MNCSGPRMKKRPQKTGVDGSRRTKFRSDVAGSCCRLLISGVDYISSTLTTTRWTSAELFNRVASLELLLCRQTFSTQTASHPSRSL